MIKGIYLDAERGSKAFHLSAETKTHEFGISLPVLGLGAFVWCWIQWEYLATQQHTHWLCTEVAFPLPQYATIEVYRQLQTSLFRKSERWHMDETFSEGLFKWSKVPKCEADNMDIKQKFKFSSTIIYHRDRA